MEGNRERTDHLIQGNYGVYYDILKDRLGFINHENEHRVIGMCRPKGAYMFDPQTVINQAMLGETPTDWDVFHGKRPSPLSMGCFFAFVIPLFVGVLALVALLLTQLVFNLLHVPVSVTTFIPVIGLIILVIVLFAGLWGYSTGKKDARDPDPLLVVTPEGFVEYFLSRHSLNAVSFTELDTIMIQMSANIRRNMSITRLRVWLELHYPDGRVERWKPKGMYGEDEDLITQSISTAFTEYANPRKESVRPSQEYTLPRKRRRKR